MSLPLTIGILGEEGVLHLERVKPLGGDTKAKSSMGQFQQASRVGRRQ